MAAAAAAGCSITWIGLQMILGYSGVGPRPMTVSQLTVICVNMHDIVWATRYLIDLIPLITQ